MTAKGEARLISKLIQFLLKRGWVGLLTNNHIEEVVLHVGLHKTGTTSIQKTLFNKDNNASLLKQGLLYPRCWKQNHGNTILGAFTNKPQEFFARKLHQTLSKEEIEKKNRLNLEQLETTLNDKLNNSDVNKLIFSGEPINQLLIQELESFKNFLLGLGLGQATFKVMIYTRNPVTWAGSMIQQRLKEGSQYDQLIDQTLPTLFQDRIGKFIEVFGKQAVHVYSFEEARTHEMGMVGHLLEEINVDKKFIKKLKQLKTNEGISMFTGKFLEYIHNKIPIRINGKPNEERHKDDHKPLHSVRGDKFDISLREKEKIKSIAQADMEWLKENYHIDYLREGLVDNEKYQYLDLSFEDVERIYPALPKILREALVEFMENKLIREIPSQYRMQCRHLIKRLKESDKNLIYIDLEEKRLQNKLDINQTDKGLMYRELALFMEAYDQVDVAETLMNKASLYRPNNRFINKKQEEYRQKLGQDDLANNEEMKNALPDLSNKEKYALFGVGIVGSAIGIINLLRKR